MRVTLWHKAHFLRCNLKYRHLFLHSDSATYIAWILYLKSEILNQNAASSQTKQEKSLYLIVKTNTEIIGQIFYPANTFE